MSGSSTVGKSREYTWVSPWAFNVFIILSKSRKSWICLKCTAHQRKSTRALDNTKACTEKRPKSPTASPNPSQSNADRLHVLAPPIAKRLPGYAKEIPNTPDQGNGVLVHEIMAPLLSQPAANIPSSLSTIDNVMTASQTDLGNRVLCYSCKKLLVLSKNIENVAWYALPNFQQKALSSNNNSLQCRIGKSIIPETPEATAHQRRSGDDSGEARIGSTRVPVNGPIDGTPPFQARFSVISSIATAPLPGQRSAANVNPQVRDDDIGVQEHNHSQGRQSLSKPQNRQQEVQEKDIEVENRERPSSIGRVDKQAATGTSDIAVQTDLPEKTSTEMRISMSASEIHTENQATINSRSTDTSEIVVPCIVQGLSADHLAGLAILAAGDVPWTNTQVVDWVADNFPTHRRGDWSWENSVCSSLSSKRFQSVKKPGVKDTAYKFSSAEICAFYKGMSALINIPLSNQAHSVFAITTPPAHSQAQDEDFEHLISRGDLTAQDKPQEDMYELFTANQDSSVQYHAQAVSEQLTPIEDSSAPEIGGFYMPFEKSTLFRATNDVDPAPHVRRERSFHKAFPEYVKPTIDTMSEADINAKIAEIRKRPSRKQVWGSRLAFKRCRGRNIHDETKGKWHPRIPIEMNENEVAIAAAKNAWREALGFPQSPIPMLHQGQLAFRDGTLVSCS